MGKGSGVGVDGTPGAGGLEEWLLRYVPHKDAERYRKSGWTLTPLLGKHGEFSVLAVRKVRPRSTRPGKARQTRRQAKPKAS
jgi:hypothetical protein